MDKNELTEQDQFFACKNAIPTERANGMLLVFWQVCSTLFFSQELNNTSGFTLWC